MDTTHTVEAFDYVNHPYARVRTAIVANPQHVFRRATAAAAVDDAVLRVDLGALEVAAEIAIDVVRVEEVPGVTVMSLRWRAAHNPGAFPTMSATLRVFPLTSTETQLALEGTYSVPLGPLGSAIDAVVGKRLAKESVARFVSEVAAWLREELVQPSAVVAIS